MNFFKKWYTYQKERFPVLTYGLYCFCVVFGTFCFCNFVAKNDVAPESYTINYYLLIPMFIVALLQFLMVRVVDEFKDYEEDCKFRPYRPVPRGLITLKELKLLFIICVILQVIITLIVNPISIVFLILVWTFFAVMSKGFFIKNFLGKHILLEVTLDEFLLPISVLFLSSFITYVNITYSNYTYLSISELLPFLVISYIVSWIIEIARKIRCKEAEETGVKTYTAVLGIPKATLLVWILETILLIVICWVIKIKIYIIIIFAIISIINILFIVKQNKLLSKSVEYMADIYVMVSLVSLVYLIL